MDVVIPFRNTCGTQELAMCVALIKKNLKIKYDKIYIIGDDCGFEDEEVINVIIKERRYNKWLDSGFLVRYYCVNHEKEFILFNDDFFLTAPVYNIPAYYFGTLENRLLSTYVIDNKINKLRLSEYGLNIDKFLDTHGDYKNFEVHIPMIVTRPDLMAVAIELTEREYCPALKRTMYMKLLGKRDRRVINYRELNHDIKFNEPLRVMQYPFFSLTDKEFDVFKKDFKKILES